MNLSVEQLKKLKNHQVADLFPPIEQSEFDALKKDIADYGQKQEILIDGSTVLDGKNRVRACLELGISCKAKEWDGKSPWFLAQSLNLKRRHLDAKQRAFILLEAIATVPELAAQVEQIKEDKAEAQQAAGEQVGKANAGKVKGKKGKGLDGQSLPQKNGKHSASKSSKKKNLNTTASALADMIGVSTSTMETCQSVAKTAPDAAKKVVTGEMKASDAFAKAKTTQAASGSKARHEAQDGKFPDVDDIESRFTKAFTKFEDDMKAVFAALKVNDPDEGVAMVLTDWVKTLNTRGDQLIGFSKQLKASLKG